MPSPPAPKTFLSESLQVRIYPGQADLAADAAQQVHDYLQQVLVTQGHAHVILASAASQVQFLDVFPPVAVNQIILALKGPDRPLQYIADFRAAEDGLDYVVTATILQPCEVRIEVHQTLEAPLPRVKVVEQSAATPGPFERRIDAQYRIHGHMLLMMLNDEECCLHRMQARHQSWQ